MSHGNNAIVTVHTYYLTPYLLYVRIKMIKKLHQFLQKKEIEKDIYM